MGILGLLLSIIAIVLFSFISIKIYYSWKSTKKNLKKHWKEYLIVGLIGSTFLFSPYFFISPPTNPPSFETDWNPSSIYSMVRQTGLDTYTMRVYAYPINYNDSGVLKPINTSFELLPTDHVAYQYGYRAYNDKGVFSVYLKPNIQSNWTVAFAYNRSDNPTQYVLRHELVGIGYIDPSQNYSYHLLQTPLSSVGSIDNDTVTYSNAFSGCDIRWTYDNEKLKEEIELSNTSKTLLQNHPPSDFGLSNKDSFFAIVTKLDFGLLNITDGEVNYTGDFSFNKSRLYFKNAKGKVLFTLPVGFVFEKFNVSNTKKMIFRFKKIGDYYYLFSGIKVTILNQMQFPVVFDPTNTIYSSTNDGRVSHSALSWDFCHDATTGSTKEDTTPALSDALSAEYFFGDYSISRSFFYFDTSVVPDDATVTNVYLNLYGSSASTSVCAMKGTQGDTLSTADYDAFTGSEYGHTTWSGDYNNISFNSQGCSDIDKTGITKICCREYSHDYLDSVPITIYNNGVYFADSPGTFRDPYLEVVYTTGTTNNPPTLSGESPTNGSTDIPLTPSLYVVCTDVDGDIMNATWWSNSSGTWVQFASNNSIANNTNITQTNNNFSSYSTTYWWSVNLSDGEGGWTNETYHFTTMSGGNPPSITFNSESQDPVGFGYGVTLNCSVSNNPDYIYCNVTYPDDSFYNNTMTNTGGDYYEITTNDSWLLGQYNYTIWAYNSYGSDSYIDSYNCSVQTEVYISTLKDNYVDNEYVNLTDPSYRDFECTLRASGGDFTGINSWRAKVSCDLTDTATKVFTVSDRGTYSSSDDGKTVTFTGGGTGTLKYINNADYALITSCSGTINTGTVTISGGHTFTISDTGLQIGDMVLSCYNDWANGFDESYIDIKDFTTDSNHHIKIWTDPSKSGTQGNNRHDGTAESGFFINCSGNSYVFVFRVGNVIVEGLEIQQPAKPSYGVLYMTSNSLHNTFRYMIIHNVGGIVYNGGGSTIENSIFYDFGSSGYSVVRFDKVRSCTVYANGCGSYSNQIIVRDAECYNVLLYNSNSGTGYHDFYSCTGDYNIGSDAYVPGTNSQQSKTLNDIKFVSTTSGSEDLHIQSTSCAVDTGTDLSSYFTDDIDGDTRSGTWDIGADEYVSGAPSNNAPSISNEYPSNSSTNVSIKPLCHIDVSDDDGDTMNISWYENTTGSWVLQQTNNSINNGTYYWNYSNASSYNTKYYWRVCVNDGTDWTNNTYSFTTVVYNDTEAPEIHTDYSWSDNDITNGSSSNFTVTITDNVGVSSATITIDGTNYSLSHGTGDTWYYEFTPSKAGNYSVTDIYAEDSNNNENHTNGLDIWLLVRNQSIIRNTGSTNIKGYLQIRIDYNNSGSWILEDNTIDENTPRTINSGDHLKLDVIFNDIVNTSVNLSHGTGMYRVYVALRDPDGNVLKNDDGSDISAYYVFQYITANNPPTQTGESPVNGSTGIYLTPSLYVVCSDNDGDTMTAYWYSNSSGSWALFATNSSVSSGTNITQSNSNFSGYNTKYWWSVNVTDGMDWCNQTYHFTTRHKYIPNPPINFTAISYNTTQINLTWSMGNNADYTYIERNTIVSWDRGDGVEIYNSTGINYNDKGLDNGTSYYYQAWGYNSTDNTFSSVDWIGLDFDGANDNVRVPDDNSLNFTSSFTIDMAIWVEDAPADDKYDTLISKMIDSSTGWGISLYSEDGTVWELQICVDGHNQSVGTASIPLNKWVYPTVVFNNTSHTMHVYINGNEIYSYNEPNSPSANTADVVIGECSYVGNDKTFDGKIDYIRVYNTDLSEQDVKYNFYWKDDNCTTDGLVSWWKFNENTDATAYDSQGSNDGTLEDGTQWVDGTKEVFNSASDTTKLPPYLVGIRNDGIDYFTWLGDSSSAWYVAQQIVGFDESSEYIAKWSNSSWSDSDGLWCKYFGDGSGTNFTVNTFDVIKVYLTDTGTQDLTVYPNPNINYDSQRIITLVNSTLNKGYNYTGYTSTMSNTLGDINGTNITLSPGSGISIWDNSTYKWITFIAYFDINSDVTVSRWMVCETKVQQTRQWVI